MSKNTITKCVGIILDGNRRWAKERGLPTLEGHRRGFDNFINIAEYVQELGIKHLVVYAFSTENWNRKPEEVVYLMDLFREMLTTKLDDLANKGVRVRIVGQKQRFEKDMQEMIERAEENTKENTGLTAWICLSYGGRAEIVEAARSAAKAGEITESTIAENLWTAGMPDPDIVIRPGGEKRLSNFLLWQVAYSELFFLDTYWPDFSKDDFDAILNEYDERERRRGK